MQGIYLFHHMKRSGGHAVIHWLMRSIPQAVFVNNDIPIQPVLAGRHCLPDGHMPYEAWVRKRKRNPAYVNAFADASTVLVSLEDHELRVRPFFHPATETIVIIRHPRNLFASRIKKSTRTSLLAYDINRPEILGRALRVWKEHAYATLKIVDVGAPLRAIFYDAWLIGADYRATLARNLVFVECHDLSGPPATEGGGSSFGHELFDHEALLRRADFLGESERTALERIMADPEIADLAARIEERIVELSGPRPVSAVLANRA
jgi:hypothetical protein